MSTRGDIYNPITPGGSSTTRSYSTVHSETSAHLHFTRPKSLRGVERLRQLESELNNLEEPPAPTPIWYATAALVLAWLFAIGLLGSIMQVAGAYTPEGDVAPWPGFVFGPIGVISIPFLMKWRKKLVQLKRGEHQVQLTHQRRTEAIVGEAIRLSGYVP